MRKNKRNAVQFEVNGLVSFREVCKGTSLPQPHSHNEIEILLIEKGWGTWLMGGEHFTFKAGQLIVFWALRPHQLVKSSQLTIKNVMTIPLSLFKEWDLPESVTAPLLAGNILVEPDTSYFAADRRTFVHWHEELKSPDLSRQKLALLEIKARLGRLGQHLQELPGTSLNRQSAPGLMNPGHFLKISKIVEYVARHFSEPITVPDIAKVIGMNPDTATKVFGKFCGMTLIQYINQHRILHAQSLLASTDMKIPDVAQASGFQSASHFHAVFREVQGISPQQFRNSSDFTKVPYEKRGGCGGLKSPAADPLKLQAASAAS